MQQRFLLQILLLAQHISGTTTPIIRSSRVLYSDYTLITNMMHWLLFIHEILFSSTCFEHQVLIFRRT